jgi:surfeit locus 1 family protein
VSLQGRFFWITVATVLALAATLALGRWQLDRAAQKEQLQARIERESRRSPLTGPALRDFANPVDAMHRAVRLRGKWLADKTVFLDNRQMQGRQGFYVVTPLQLEGELPAVLVQRGWVARDFLARDSLPVVGTPEGRIEIEGRVAPPPARLLDMGQEAEGPIRQNLDLTAFAAEIRRPMLAVSVVQTDSSSDGLMRDWPVVASGADKNYGYAFQWFGLSALISILYIWFQIVKRFNVIRRA